MQQFITQLIRLTMPYKRTIGLALVLLIALEAVLIAPTYLFKELLDALTEGNGTVQIILLIAGAIFLVEMIATVIDVLADRTILRILYWLESYLPQEVQKKLLSLSLGYHEQEQTGKQITKLERGTMKVIEFGAQLLWMLIPLVFQILWTIVVMILVDWQLAAIFAAVLPLFALLTVHLHKTTHNWRQEQEDLHEESSAQLCESVMHIKTVQAFAQETREAAQYKNKRERIEHLGSLRWTFGTRMNFWRMLITNTARFLIMGLAGYKALNGDLSIGSVVLFLTLSEKVYISMFNLNQILDRMVEATDPIRRMFTILTTEPRVPVKKNALVPHTWDGKVEFANVAFGYTADQRALEDVSFTIAPGETVAFAGPSGGGKSTLVKLLFRYYDPNSGSIRIDGRNLKDLDLQAYRSQTGYVPQEVEIMSGTIWDNIRYGHPEAKDDAVRTAAKLARVDEFAQVLPQGYDTRVGERGMKLSGGQRQRVGIARALLTDPSILVFDEATSNLDAESERAIQDALKTVEGTKTLILIAHRLSTIMHADKIIIIDGGRVTEVGTHDELMAKGGVYSKLVQLQTEGNL